MAATLDIEIRAQDNASKVFKQTQDAAESTGASIVKMAAGLGLGLGLEQGLGKVKDLLGESVKAAVEDEASQARLKQAVENTGASYGDYAKTLDDVVKKGQSLGFQDDQTRSALSILTAQTGDASEAMKRYAIAQDLSRGADIDVVTASRLLGKVTDENVSALDRYGIAVAKGSSESELFAAIQQKFGGQAAAFADTTAGKWAILNDRIHEGEEGIGRLATPALTNATTNAIMLIDELSKIPTAIAKIPHMPDLNFKIDGINLTNAAIGGLVPGYNLFTSSAQKADQAQDSFNHDMDLFNSIVNQNQVGIGGLGGSLDALQQHLSGINSSLTDASIKWSQLVDSQVKNIQSSAEQKSATDAAWQALAQSNDVTDQATVAAHNQEIADAAAAKAKSAQAEASAAYAKTLPGMVQALKDAKQQEDLQYSAQQMWNQEMGISVDRMGNAILPMQNLVDAQMDQIDASKRQAEATREAYLQEGMQVDANGQVIKSFQQMVEEQKTSILASQQMQKATDEANKELGIVTDTIDSTTSSVDSLSSSLDKATTGWHQMTDAESQSAAAARSAPANSQAQQDLGTKPGPYPAQSGSVAYFLSGYPSHAGGLPYVPYDNYPALLHKGEAVVPAGQNTGSGGLTINVNVSGSINGVDDVKRIIRDALNGGGFRGLLT